MNLYEIAEFYTAKDVKKWKREAKTEKFLRNIKKIIAGALIGAALTSNPGMSEKAREALPRMKAATERVMGTMKNRVGAILSNHGHAWNSDKVIEDFTERELNRINKKLDGIELSGEEQLYIDAALRSFITHLKDVKGSDNEKARKAFRFYENLIDEIVREHK